MADYTLRVRAYDENGAGSSSETSFEATPFTTVFSSREAGITATGVDTLEQGVSSGHPFVTLSDASSWIFRARGTDMTMTVHDTASKITFTVDGVESTPTAVGEWPDLVAFSGLSDTYHTVEITCEGGGYVDIVETFALTGSAPAVAYSTTYGPSYYLRRSDFVRGYPVLAQGSVPGGKGALFTFYAGGGATVRCRAQCTTLKLFLEGRGGTWLVRRDGVDIGTAVEGSGNQFLTMATGLDANTPHEYEFVKIIKTTPATILYDIIASGGTVDATYEPADIPSALWLGDSIVDTSADIREHYTHIAATAAGFVANISGSGGATVPPFLSDWGSAQPTVVFDCYGTNDIAQGVSRADFKSKLENFLAGIASATTGTVYACGILDRTGYASEVADFNTAKQEVVATLANPRILYLDRSGWIDPATETSDGLHPNALGNAALATEFAAVLNAL